MTQGNLLPSADVLVCARIGWQQPAALDRNDLFAKGVRNQWKEDDVDWAPVEFGSAIGFTSEFDRAVADRSPFRERKVWDRFRWELQAWSVSQIFYGEHAALVLTGRLVEGLGESSSKCIAALQCFDEARHVRVLERYLDEVIEYRYPVAAPMADAIQSLLQQEELDAVMLGLQVVLEGIALAGLRMGDATMHDPTIIDISRRIARDEARHMSFGIKQLRGSYDELTTRERAERVDFLLTVITRMHERLLFDDVWTRMGLDVKVGRAYALEEPSFIAFRRMLFSSVHVALRRIGMWQDVVGVFRDYGLVD